MKIAPAKTNFTAETNKTYYNEIANDYDAMLERDDTNKDIRKVVKRKFEEVLQSGLVLDFGGGSGLDLDWLLNNNYRVIFCEPSQKMRMIAMERQNHNESVRFLTDDQVDFVKWGYEQPFDEKVDAVLADFAVFNCIENIDLLLNRLASVMKPGGQLVALMLKYGDQKSIYWKFRKQLRSLILRKPMIINVGAGLNKQIVFVYSLREIKRASSSFFNFQASENLPGFTLFHWTRK